MGSYVQHMWYCTASNARTRATRSEFWVARLSTSKAQTRNIKLSTRDTTTSGCALRSSRHARDIRPRARWDRVDRRCQQDKIVDDRITLLCVWEFSKHKSKVNVVRDHASHKWLSKSICFRKGSLHCHAVDSRISSAIRTFYAKRHTLCAKHIPNCARLIYFN